MGINDEIIEKIKEWSEGNEYLYSLLYLCWEKSIQTHASCCGHENHPYPYISIILNQNSLPYVESIISSVEEIENIVVSCNYRHHSDINFQDNIPDSERRSLTIYCQMHNRCEVFFKLACAIEGLPKKIKTEKGEKFFKSLLKFMEMEDNNIKEYLKDGLVVSSTLSTLTDDFHEFKEYKKKEALYGNTLLQFFSKKIRDKNEKYYGKYPIQNEYQDSPSTGLK